MRAVVALLVLGLATAASAQSPTIREIQVEQEGRQVIDRVVLGLLETTVGEPLSMADVRETFAHLNSLNRFDDIRVYQEPVANGIRLRYVLYPLHPVDRVEFRGMLGLPESDLRDLITERFGEAPPAARMADVVDALIDYYAGRGYFAVTISPRLEEFHDPDRSTMALAVEPGVRSVIGTVQIAEIDSTDRPSTPGPIDIRAGQPYDAQAIREELDRYAASLRARGYYEIAASHNIVIQRNGTVDVRVTVDRGPRIALEFRGDPLPEDDREQLVTVEEEGSVDEDLLEDTTFAIEEYLRARGYRDAVVQYTRQPNGADLTIAFDIKRGRRYVIDQINVAGNTTLTNDEVLQLLLIKPGEPFVQSRLNTGAGNVANLYRTRGFTRPQVLPAVVELPDDGAAADGEVRITVNITEGARTLVGAITFEGHAALSEAQLRNLLRTAPGRPYSESDLVQSRDAIDQEYRNRGYETVVVTPTAALAENSTRADVRFTIVEGPQVLVDHIIIVGNERTDTETIERELLLRPGEPLGYNALIESQARLAALGLFRLVRIEPLALGSQPRRDVLVRVEEAPPNTIDFGGGIEGGTRLRPTGDGGQAEERFEFAPRGFFQIGRRNLWGKNRSINLFTRVTLRSRDIVLSSSGVRLEQPGEGGYGFNEYRALLTYREPRWFNTPADLLVTGILDQAIRSSFNFITREVRAELGVRLPRRFSAAGRYSFENTRLFDERFTEDEKPLIDRIFPQVRLSKFSMSLVRDSRTDALDPDNGTFFVLDNEFSARAIGSEVGFVKSLVQGFGFYRLPTGRRAVLAMGARLGVSQGFDESTLQDLPASERFFAGGDTTVRGFSLDRLGTPETISASGFPLGGNGLVILNGELRVDVLGDIGAVGFIDAGNVFQRASHIDFGQLRAAAGFGLRYQSPVGPIRADLGFKLDRKELSPGRLERGYVLHISLGQAF